MTTPPPTPASSREAHEAHLRALGLPLMVAPSVRLRQSPRRSAGTAAGLAAALSGIAALSRADDLAVERVGALGADSPDVELHLDGLADPIAVLLLAGAALLLLSPVIGLGVGLASRRLRAGAGTVLGVAALLALLVLPAVAFPSAGGPGFGSTAVLAGVVLVGSHLGVGSLLRWSARRVRRELGTMGPMIARVLPVLMLAVLFLFFTSELWQVMVGLSWPRTLAVLGTMAVLTVLLVVVTTRDDLRRELADGAPGVRLRLPERLNLLLVPVVTTLIQAALFAALVFAFFVFLGWLSVPDATETRWTVQPAERLTGLAEALPVSVTLVRVALVLAAFSALNLAASAASDPAHRARFVRPMLDEVVDGVSAREAYSVALDRDRRTGRGVG